jgi:digeranylgeranylglycerophospholipid reductase
VQAEVVVVGGGPSGSTVARLLAKDHDVTIIEEHPIPGEPLQCAGLVTRRGIPDFAKNCILGDVKGARLHSPLGFTLTLEAKATRACVIDRSQFDKTMFHEAVDNGALPRVGSSVKDLADKGKEVRCSLSTERRAEELVADAIVGADGYRSICRRAARLPPPKHMLTGIQADLKGVDLDHDFVELYFGRSIAPGFFAWAIPAEDLTRVGLCTWDSEVAPAVFLKKFLTRSEFSKGRRVSLASGKIPIGPGRTAARGRIALVGDAACHAKPLSGGGVYTGVRGGELCAQAVHGFLNDLATKNLGEYDTLWKDEFGKELSRAFRVRKVFLNLTDKKIDKALRIFAEPDVHRLLEQHGDIDYPASLSSAVLKLAPKLAQFSPQIIESLL